MQQLDRQLVKSILGQDILRASAEYVRPVTLELGGKSPLVIFDDFDVDTAVQGLLFYYKTVFISF